MVRPRVPAMLLPVGMSVPVPVRMRGVRVLRAVLVVVDIHVVGALCPVWSC